MAQAVVGRQIELISKSQIRYTGTLQELDPAKGIIALSNVRVRGTEGRRNGINEQAEQAGEYEYVTFKAGDVLDLKFSEEYARPKAGPIDDPAIVSSSAPKPSVAAQKPTPITSAPTTAATAAAAPLTATASTRAEQTTASLPTVKDKPQTKASTSQATSIAAAPGSAPVPGTSPSPAPAPAPAALVQEFSDLGLGEKAAQTAANVVTRDQGDPRHARLPGTGGHLTRGRGGRGRPAGNASLHDGRNGSFQTPAPVSIQGDFDFVSSNAKFDKPTEDDVVIPPASGAAATEASANGHHSPGYNKKSSFFDNISSDARDRAQGLGTDGRQIRQQERKINMETFGQAGTGGGGGGGFRGRGRGGRGGAGPGSSWRGGRGRGRGDRGGDNFRRNGDV